MTSRFSIILNYLSLVVLASGGLIINALIARFYDPAVLGVFNQAFAFYLTAAQFAALGVHFSILRAVSAQRGDDTGTNQTIMNGVVVSLALAVIASVALFLCAPSIGQLLDSPQVARAILWVAPAVGLFGVNKCLLAAVNGLQRMSLYAVAQMLRYLALVGFIAVCCMSAAPSDQLSSVFLYAEAILLVVLSVALRRSLNPTVVPFSRRIMREHLIFGARGFLGGILVELNTRVDVLILGVFLSDASVGTYSLASFFAEGFYQLPVVIRTFVAPKVALLLATDQKQTVRQWIRLSVHRVYPIAILAAPLCVCVCYLYLRYVAGIDDTDQILMVLSILLSGIVIISPLIPFDSILLLSGHPGRQSLLLGMVVTTNLVLNILFIALFGVLGAATATAIAFIAGAFYLQYLVNLTCNISLLDAAFGRDVVTRTG